MGCDLDDDENLAKFFNVIEMQFNNNLFIKKSLKNKIVRFFEYKWHNDKNQAIDDPDEKELLE